MIFPNGLVNGRAAHDANRLREMMSPTLDSVVLFKALCVKRFEARCAVYALYKYKLLLLLLFTSSCSGPHI